MLSLRYTSRLLPKRPTGLVSTGRSLGYVGHQTEAANYSRWETVLFSKPDQLVTHLANWSASKTQLALMENLALWVQQRRQLRLSKAIKDPEAVFCGFSFAGVGAIFGTLDAMILTMEPDTYAPLLGLMPVTILLGYVGYHGLGDCFSTMFKQEYAQKRHAQAIQVTELIVRVASKK